MRKLLQKISEDRQAVVGRLNGGESSLTIPDDLVFEILLRLPGKSIARCGCLSKLWASIFDSQDFTDRYLTISSARPQLLFAFQEDGEFILLFLNSESRRCPITATYHMSFPVNDVKEIYSPISGLVCFKDKRIAKGRRVWVICNPSTGQSFTLPRMEIWGEKLFWV
uniref:F-box domain-containing protein n=1 Tax=Brassica oleracea var. oleracea TaxID=109376 RepID=A0A0D3EHK2_BRAOL